MYYANWCGHCVAYKPEWDAIKKLLQKNGINTAEYEHSENKELMKREGINGFPTLKYVNQKGDTEIITDRSTEGIMNKFNLNINMTGGGGCKHGKKCTKCSDPYYAKYIKYKKIFRIKKYKLIIIR